MAGVQIPLWAMATGPSTTRVNRAYHVQIPLWAMATQLSHSNKHLFQPVQIPLWAMATIAVTVLLRFLASSDSSMGNGNDLLPLRMPKTLWVQIPLWAMATVAPK